jgi:predicted regulator of Ras-like GTPase activity (Roadblock/LC7/MglB family)
MIPLTSHQPAVRGLVERISQELGTRAVILLHENGQILQSKGWIDDAEIPAMAALVAAMIAAGKSLDGLGAAFGGAPSRFSCDSESRGLYTIAVMNGIWLSVLYEQPLNPGQFRMKVRRYAEHLAQLGVKKPEQWEVTDFVHAAASSATLSPVSSKEMARPEKLTAKNSSLFGNISDEEIDELFENARS